MATPDEFGLIARWFAPLAADEPGAFGLGDDAATIALAPDRELVVTTDMLVADVHFFAADPAGSIGRKLLAVNLSDLAAMGADPQCYVLAIALPAAWGWDRLPQWLDGFVEGLAAMQAEFGIGLSGGDTVSTQGPLTLCVTAFGTVPAGAALRRAGAKPGDIVWVSGQIGDGVLGLRVLRQQVELPAELADAAVERYRRPLPRVALGRELRGRARACADISDGLVADLGHICAASAVVATIEAERVPLSPAGRTAVAADPALLTHLLSGGDDYELVFTAPEDLTAQIRAAGEAAGVAVTPIGSIDAVCTETAGSDGPVRVVAANGHPMPAVSGGWRHF
jgi:thiamine-monophosphate kinase